MVHLMLRFMQSPNLNQFFFLPILPWLITWCPNALKYINAIPIILFLLEIVFCGVCVWGLSFLFYFFFVCEDFWDIIYVGDCIKLNHGPSVVKYLQLLEWSPLQTLQGRVLLEVVRTNLLKIIGGLQTCFLKIPQESSVSSCFYSLSLKPGYHVLFFVGFGYCKIILLMCGSWLLPTCSVVVVRPQPSVVLSTISEVSVSAKKTSDHVSTCNVSAVLTIRHFQQR